MSEDERQLLAVILDRRDEDVPRLMYADAIEERDPARAEFIRVQVKMATMKDEARAIKALESDVLAGPPEKWTCMGKPISDEFWRSIWDYRELRRRERELLDANFTDWFALFPEQPGTWSTGRLHRGDGLNVCGWASAGYWYEPERGFVSHLSCSWSDWSRRAAAILKAQPIEKVVLMTRPNLRPCTLEGQRKEWVDDNGNLVLTAGWLMANGNLGEEEVLGFKKTISRREILAGDEQRARELFNLELDRAMTIEGFLKAKWRRIEFELPTERPTTMFRGVPLVWTDTLG